MRSASLCGMSGLPWPSGTIATWDDLSLHLWPLMMLDQAWQLMKRGREGVGGWPMRVCARGAAAHVRCCGIVRTGVRVGTLRQRLQRAGGARAARTRCWCQLLCVLCVLCVCVCLCSRGVAPLPLPLPLRSSGSSQWGVRPSGGGRKSSECGGGAVH